MYVPFEQDNRHSKPHQEKPTFSLSKSASLRHRPRTAVEVQSHIPRYGAMVKAEGFAKRVASVSIYVFNYVAMGETTRLGFLTVWDGLSEKGRGDTSGKVVSMDLII